jgi:ubiquinone biosynthesis protein
MLDIKHAYKDARRLKQIASAMFKSGLGHYIYQLKLSHHLFWHQRVQKQDKPKDLPRKVRMALDELGGSFVKLGQLLSLRPDLIPEEFCKEFAELQDDVNGFSYGEVKEIVENELKHKLEDMFSHFEKEPIASASIGQVHKARLKNGIRAVVKVQRPGIDDLMEIDIDLLYHLSELLMKHVKEVQGHDLKSLVDEFKRYTFNELDYLKEGRNIERFYKNFKHDKSVKIPKLYPDFSSSRVLTMGYIDGIPIDDKEGFRDWECDEKIISKNMANFFLKQYLEFGFFHADPHPANVFVLPGNKIALLDYGICGTLTEDMKDRLIDMLIALSHRDVDGVVDQFLDLGMIKERDEKLVNELGIIVEDFADTSIEDLNVVHLFDELIFVARRYGVSLPVDLVLLVKSIVTGEGTGQQLDPGFNLSSVMGKYVEELTSKRLKPGHVIKTMIDEVNDFTDNIKLVPKQLNELLVKLKKGELGVHFERKDLVQLEREIDKSSSKVSLGVIIAALIVASALVLQVNNGKWLSVIGFLIAIFLTINLFISIIKERRVVV